MAKISSISDLNKKQPQLPTETTIDNEIDNKIVKCPKCKSILFVNAVVLKKISAIESPNGVAGIGPVAMPFICLGCGRKLEETDLNMEHETIETLSKKDSGLIITP